MRYQGFDYSPPPTPNRRHRPPARRPACLPALHGQQGHVIQRAASHELLCLRHQRWLHGPEQHALHALPEICTANRRHRRLRRRHDEATLNTALTQARNLIGDWLDAADQRHLQQRWTQRLNQLRNDPAADPYRPSHYRIELATYPETVLLAGLLASPPARTVLHKREAEPLAASALRAIGLSAPADET
jgi:hypothetical protein